MERINCSSSYVSQEPKICVPRGQGTQKEEEGEKKKSSSEHKSVGGGWVTLPLRRGKPFVCMKVVVGGTT